MYNKISVFAKTNLNSIEALFSRSLINLSTSQDKFVLLNNVLI